MANTISAASLPIALFPRPGTFVYVCSCNINASTISSSPQLPMHVYNPSTEYRIYMEICICMYVPAQYVVRTYILDRIPRTPLLRKRQIGGCLLSPGSTLPPSHLCIHAKAHLSSLRLRITHTRTKRVQICRADPRYVHMKLRKVNYSYILHRYLE